MFIVWWCGVGLRLGSFCSGSWFGGSFVLRWSGGVGEGEIGIGMNVWGVLIDASVRVRSSVGDCRVGG